MDSLGYAHRDRAFIVIGELVAALEKEGIGESERKYLETQGRIAIQALEIIANTAYINPDQLELHRLHDRLSVIKEKIREKQVLPTEEDEDVQEALAIQKQMNKRKTTLKATRR
jgi:hypothetical protein